MRPGDLWSTRPPGQTMASASRGAAAAADLVGCGGRRRPGSVHVHVAQRGRRASSSLSITVTADAGAAVMLDYNSNGTPDTNRSASITAQSTLGSYPDLHARALTVDPSSVTPVRRHGHRRIGATATWATPRPAGSWYDAITVVNTTTGQTLTNASVTRGSSGKRIASRRGQAEARLPFALPSGASGRRPTQHHRHGRRGR